MNSLWASSEGDVTATLLSSLSILGSLPKPLSQEAGTRVQSAVTDAL